MCKNYWLSFILLTFSYLSIGQNEARYGEFPIASTYSVNDYKASAQIWHGVQGREGRLFFANNKGVLVFDGSRWTRISTHKEGRVTRLLKAYNDTIYIAGENEIGEIVTDSTGQFIIKPLLSKAMVDYKLGAIWNIQERTDHSLLFFGNNGVLSYKKGIGTKLLTLSKGKITTSLRFGGGFLVLVKFDHVIESSDVQLLFLPDGKADFVSVNIPQNVALKNIRGVIEDGEKRILFDEKGKTFTCIDKGNGNLVWTENTIVFEGLENYKVNCVTVKKDFVYIGTDANGLVVYDKKGDFIRLVGADQGIQNLSVFELFFDRNANLWLLLDNGIAVRELSSPVTMFTEKEGILASTEAMASFEDTYVLATRSDLFINKKVNSKVVFENSGIIHEPTFDVDVFNTSFGKKCLVIGYNGVYEVDKNWTKKIVKYDLYAWTLFQSTQNQNIIYCGLDAPGGIGQLEITEKGWKYETLIENCGGEVRSLAEKNNKIYFAVKEKGIGIFNILTKDVHYISEQPKLANNLVYFISSFQNQLFVGSNNGLYTIDTEKGILVPVKNVKGGILFEPKLYVHRLYNENNNRLWMVLFRNEESETESREIGFLQKVDGDWLWEKAPLPVVEKDVIHEIMHDDKGLIWFGGEKGVYVYNVKAKDELNIPFSVQISKVSTEKDTIYNLKNSLSSSLTMDFVHNSIKIEFSTPVFYGTASMEYRTRLKGFDVNWSDWSKINATNFSKLPEGTYTFEVESKDIYGNKSAISSFNFIILPPWYRTWWAYSLYVICAVLLIVLITRISVRRVTLQNQKLEDTVKVRTQEIAEQNHQLEHQKNEIQAKNQDILDSIKYAKRIQNTILPDDEKLNSLFSEYFVFYQPKDIVSGDFYWADNVNGYSLFSSVDCTGHGVPGAFVSIVANNGLRRSTNEFGLFHPNEVLDKLQEVVTESFRSQSQSEVKDGMDLALCAINKDKTKLEFAGANNPCIIVRKGEIIELKADKQPIGQYENSKSFTLHTFDLEKGDCIYLYSDGYIDQFGGEKGKKFKSAPFKVLLSTIYQLPMKEQYKIIQNTFDNWKQDLEQIDDVCVFGVKI